MKNLDIKATYSTPKMTFNLSNGNMEIYGRSIPDNCYTFFLPLMESVDEYSKNPQKDTYIIMELEYFNTGTSKVFYDFLVKLSTLKSNVTIEWRYEEDDEDILETGQDFETLSDGKITFIFVEL